VIALEQYLIAAAGAHHLMAETAHASGIIACAEQHEHT
jgi:hypothetical protein